MSELTEQSVIGLYSLSHVQAGLSAQASMGILMEFDALADTAIADIKAGLRARRISKIISRHLDALESKAHLLAAHEIIEVMDSITNKQTKGDGTFKVTFADAILLMNALDRARLAGAIMFQLCDAFGLAPNGKPLPEEE